MRSANRLHYAWIVAGVTFLVGLFTAGVRAAPGRADRPARTRIRLVAGNHLLRYRRQPAALRSRRSVCRGGDGPVWRASHDDPGARGDRRGGGDVAGDAPGVAAGPALGCRRRASPPASSAPLSPPISRRAGSAAARGWWSGFLTAANAAGQLVFLPNLAELVTHFGWRMMSLVLGRRGGGICPAGRAFDARPAA